MSATFADWLIDTFVYTGLLIAAVLLLRRPVSRWCGPQVAYALWALPMLRFVMPPLVLPASMAPAAATPGEPLLVIISDPDPVGPALAAGVPEIGIAAIDLLLPLWLGGAFVFLCWRAREYRRMRHDLLAGARPVGEAGRVRLVETPQVRSPVAFGVLDKVVALPPAFMAHHDLAARDLAIAHELAHHRGHDLLANIAAQPLLALHWFNPFAWWGWRAMRKDQEAACDARVIAGRGRAERAAYAEVIAGFAAGNHLALAAPMACPVLGEKSIIHRLRSLTMSDVPSGRRRLGIAALVTTALALPFTASISYAQADLPPAPPAPPAPPLAEQPPVPPAPPAPPAPPSIERIDPDRHAATEEGRHGAEAADRRVVHRVVRRAGRGEREFSASDTAFDEAEFEQMMAELERELEGMEGMREEVRVALAEAERAMAQAKRLVVLTDTAPGGERLGLQCSGDEPVIERELADGRRATMVCQRVIEAQAASGLRAAREALSRSRELPADAREEALREIDHEIRRMEKRQVSSLGAQAVAPASYASLAIAAPEGAPRATLRVSFGRAAVAPAAPDCPEQARGPSRTA